MCNSILISACLLGENCRYDSGNCRMKGLEKSSVNWISVCPEVAGNLSIPREKAELQDDAVNILESRQGITNISGEDVAEAFVNGAENSLLQARKHSIQFAILKSRSPSCGYGHIYDGSFSGKLISGNGVFDQLVADNGITVISSDETEKIADLLKTNQ